VADDFPFVAWSQWPDTLLTQIRPVSDLRFLVEKILSAIRDLGVDCLHAPLLTRALVSGEGGLVVGEHSRISQPCVESVMPSLRPRSIPTSAFFPWVSARIQPQDCNTNVREHPGKRSGFDPSFNFPVSPKTNFASVKPHDRPCDRNRLVFEGHPTETARPAPSQFGFPGASTAIDIVVTDFLSVWGAGMPISFPVPAEECAKSLCWASIGYA
jgi:hypothetical protein